MVFVSVFYLKRWQFQLRDHSKCLVISVTLNNLLFQSRDKIFAIGTLSILMQASLEEVDLIF